jgi:lysophospholipase L1-like esterase
MVELALANDITPVVCSVLPAADFPWRAGQNPAERIPALNSLLKKVCLEHQIAYVDYFAAMVNANNGLDAKWAYDGVHPTAEGYREMEKVLIPILDQLLPQWKH